MWGEKLELTITISFILLLLACVCGWIRGASLSKSQIESFLAVSMDIITLEIGLLILLAGYYTLRGYTLQPPPAVLYSQCASGWKEDKQPSPPSLSWARRDNISHEEEDVVRELTFKERLIFQK